MLEKLRSAGVRVELFRHSGEPSPEAVDSAVRMIREKKLDGVVAVGGGSILDLAKAAAAGALHSGPIADYVEGVGAKAPEGKRLPLFAAPTTAGTGSEATKNAVLSRVGNGGFKKSLRHDAFIPDVAILDPRAATACPREVTAGSGLDAVTQLLEAYVSTKATPMTDALAADGLSHAGWAFEKVLADPNDLEARQAMAYAAFLSGVCLANAGLGFVHGAASPIGARKEVPHGIFCGLTLLPSVAETLPLLDPHDSKGSRALAKYQSAAGLLAAANDDLVARLEELSRAAALPKLSHYGVSEADILEVAREAGAKNHPVALDEAAKVRILQAAM